MKIKPAFRIEWEYGPNKPVLTLAAYHRSFVLGFVFNATKHIVQSLVWHGGKMS